MSLSYRISHYVAIFLITRQNIIMHSLFFEWTLRLITFLKVVNFNDIDRYFKLKLSFLFSFSVHFDQRSPLFSCFKLELGTWSMTCTWMQTYHTHMGYHEGEEKTKVVVIIIKRQTMTIELWIISNMCDDRKYIFQVSRRLDCTSLLLNYARVWWKVTKIGVQSSEFD